MENNARFGYVALDNPQSVCWKRLRGPIEPLRSGAQIFPAHRFIVGRKIAKRAAQQPQGWLVGNWFLGRPAEQGKYIDIIRRKRSGDAWNYLIASRDRPVGDFANDSAAPSS